MFRVADPRLRSDSLLFNGFKKLCFPAFHMSLAECGSGELGNLRLCDKMGTPLLCYGVAKVAL